MKKLLLLSLLLSSCNLFSPSSTQNTAQDRDTKPFPNKAQPLRIIEIEFTPTVDYIYIKNMADSGVPHKDWKLRLASSKIVRSLNFDFSGAALIGSPTSLVLSSMRTIYLPPNIVQNSMSQRFERLPDTLELLTPSAEVAQRVIITEQNKRENAVLPFWNNSFPLRVMFVSPNPRGPDDGRELIMLHNTSADTVSVTGWRVVSTRGNQIRYFTDNINNPPRNFRIAPFTKWTFQFNGGAWMNNTADTLIFQNPAGREVQRISWGDISATEQVNIYPTP